LRPARLDRFHSGPTWFNDVLIENNVIQDVPFGEILFKQLDDGYGWAVRSSSSDSTLTAIPTS
jgi:hypothetical protein